VLFAHPRASDQRDLRVVTSDAVALSGIAVPSTATTRPGQRPITFVVAHGFTNTVAYPPFLRLVGWLQRFGAVRALDFRGRGRRPGRRRRCGGDPGPVDGRRRRAAPAKGPRCPHHSHARGGPLQRGHKNERDTRPMRRVHWLLETTAGRVLGSRVVRLRLDEPWRTLPLSPLQVVHRIAPTPLLLVHGDRDEYFPIEHFRTLVQAAGPAATAWAVPGLGHAESAVTAPLVERIGRWASATINP
jgi:hypothetical protein